MKYLFLPIVIPFIFLSCGIYPFCGNHGFRFVELSFQNKTDNTINVYVGQNSEDSTHNIVLDIESKKDGVVGYTKQPSQGAKESLTTFVDNILVKDSKQDTLLYLSNKDEILEYLKGKRTVDRGTFVIKIKQPK